MKPWNYLTFKINQDAIAKTLCIKKEVKNNTCQGKCHLRKMLKNTSDEEGQSEQSKSKTTKLKITPEVLFCEEPICFIPSFVVQTNTNNHLQHTTHVLPAHSNTTFQPPIFA